MPKNPKYISPIVSRIQHLEAEDSEGTISQADFEEMEELRDRRHREIRDAIPLLSCCDEIRKMPVVRFRVSNTYSAEEKQGQRHALPAVDMALLALFDRDAWLRQDGPPAVKFCPFCATPVPKMRRKLEPPKDVMTCSDGDKYGGNYCDTCAERLRSCCCLPPEALFEPEPESEADELVTLLTNPDFENNEAFARVVNLGMKLLPSLVTPDILARAFGATLSTVERWTSGKAAPPPIMRRPVYHFIQIQLQSSGSS